MPETHRSSQPPLACDLFLELTTLMDECWRKTFLWTLETGLVSFSSQHLPPSCVLCVRVHARQRWRCPQSFKVQGARSDHVLLLNCVTLVQAICLDPFLLLLCCSWNMICAFYRNLSCSGHHDAAKVLRPDPMTYTKLLKHKFLLVFRHSIQHSLHTLPICL